MTHSDDAKPLLPVGKPVRLLAHDWPFLYSLLRNGDLVVNKRLPATSRSLAHSRKEVAEPVEEEQLVEL